MSIITRDHKPVVNAFHLAVLTEATPVSFESGDRSSYAGLLLKGRKKGRYYILNNITLKPAKNNHFGDLSNFSFAKTKLFIPVLAFYQTIFH